MSGQKSRKRSVDDGDGRSGRSKSGRREFVEPELLTSDG